MKCKNPIALVACLACLGLVTGCPGGGGSSSNPPPTGPAAQNLNGKTLSVTVSSGAAPFSTGGTYTLVTTSGDGTSGRYQLNGNGGVQSNSGTYTYSVTGANTSSLVETEDINGTVVNNTLTFQSATSGTIASTSPNTGGFQNGSFTLN